MELTDEILLKNDFVNNHEERTLGKFYCHGEKPTQYRIMVEKTYKPLTNTLGYVSSAYNCNESGQIVKRSSASVITEVEDLQMIIDLCKIDKKIKVE